MGANHIVLARFTAKIIFLNSNSNYWGRYSGGGDVMARTVRAATSGYAVSATYVYVRQHRRHT
jgi:hypothetical protein